MKLEHIYVEKVIIDGRIGHDISDILRECIQLSLEYRWPVETKLNGETFTILPAEVVQYVKKQGQHL